MARLTEQIVADLVTPETGETFLWDGDIKGLGLRVRPNGTKSFILQYRTLAGKQRKLSLGGFPSVTVTKARSNARILLGEIEGGADPAMERKASRAAAKAPKPDIMTVQKAFDRFKIKHLDGRRSGAEMARALEVNMIPDLGAKAIGEVTRADVRRVLDGIEERGAGYMRNRVHAHVRRFFGWCVEHDLVDQNPAEGLPKWQGEITRDRVLSDTELAAIWHGAEALGQPFGPLVKLLILTAQRLNEVAGMRWSELDLSKNVWNIPASRAKNGKTHDVPLSGAALGVIAKIPKLSNIDLLFTTTGETPVSGFSRAKSRLDIAAQKWLDKQAIEKKTEPVTLDPWRIHDLRRTTATGMAAMNIPVHVVEKLLNHLSGSIQGVAAVYNRHAYADERKSALTAWADYVQRLVPENKPNPQMQHEADC